MYSGGGDRQYNGTIILVPFCHVHAAFLVSVMVSIISSTSKYSFASYTKVTEGPDLQNHRQGDDNAICTPIKFEISS